MGSLLRPLAWKYGNEGVCLYMLSDLAQVLLMLVVAPQQTDAHVLYNLL